MGEAGQQRNRQTGKQNKCVMISLTSVTSKTSAFAQAALCESQIDMSGGIVEQNAYFFLYTGAICHGLHWTVA